MKKIFSTLILFSLFSCGNGKDKVPDSVLQIDKMVQVQVDIHMLEADRDQRTLDQSLNGTDTFNFRTVFDKNKVTKSQYDSSMMFYTAHPQLLDEVYDKVINELNKMQSEEKKK